jgi:predicted transposase/invertase (TIGR01784 family)
MIFINPKTDFAFKRIFGSEQSKDILISFLNALLYNGESTIQDLTILNPYQAPRIRGVKDTYLDVKAKITGDITVIIEMQVLNVEGFEKRILYNAAKAYSIQLDRKDAYSLLNPVIALTITDFEMFPDWDRVVSRFILKEKDYLVDYLIYDLELVFVELPKFQKNLEELSTIFDKWTYFLKEARMLEVVPETMGAVPEIQRAFEIANQANLNREELEDLEHQEIFIHDQRNAILKGFNQGVKQGVQQGVQQGLQQGEKQAKLDIARQLLDLLDEETISQRTGLTLEEVQQLKGEQGNDRE